MDPSKKRYDIYPCAPLVPKNVYNFGPRKIDIDDR